MSTSAQRIQELTSAVRSQKPKVALDTCCVQYYISDPPVQPWADCLDPIFRAGLDGKVDLYVSTVVVSELLAQVHFTNRRRTGYDPELGLLAILTRHFQILDVDGDVARAAGRLRGTYAPGDKMSLATPDALIGATSIANGHTLFITNDAQLARALPHDNRIYLQEVVIEQFAQQFPAKCLEGTDEVKTIRRGAGLPGGASLATLELGSLKPTAHMSWRRVLSDAFTVGSALNEPCVFLVLSQVISQRVETTEVLFWHEGLNGVRPVSRIRKRLHDHLGYSPETGKAVNVDTQLHVFCLTSLHREHARQSQTGFSSKTDQRRQADAWQGYLSPLWSFRSTLGLPQTTWLLCEDGLARQLKSADTIQFLDRARNVFGWEGVR